MIIDCISDLHGFYPKLEGGNLLIVAGDLTANDSSEQQLIFRGWLSSQRYQKIILIAGNHDNNFIKEVPTKFAGGIEYLCDSETEFCGMKIWGSPWTTKFAGINPHCCAFTVDNDEDLQEKYDLIPSDIDILITHNPAYGILDKTINGNCVGSRSLLKKSLEIRPKLHVFGHIHEDYGHYYHENEIKFVNASHVNERYNPVNNPVRIIL